MTGADLEGFAWSMPQLSSISQLVMLRDRLASYDIRLKFFSDMSHKILRLRRRL